MLLKQRNSFCYEQYTQHFQTTFNLSNQKQQSLERLLRYLCEVESIHYNDQIGSEVLIHYIRHHIDNDFQSISFRQAIKDIKAFYSLLIKDPHFKKTPKLDLSLLNSNLWKDLSAHYKGPRS